MRLVSLATVSALALLASSCFAAEGKKDEDTDFFGGGFGDTGKIVINAADAKKVVAPMRLREDKEAAKGKYLDTPDSPPGGKKIKGGHAEFEVEVKEAGIYRLHLRGWWPDNCGDSVYASIDGKTRFRLTGPTTKRWKWVTARNKLFKLAEGKHALKVANCEDGARFDQILLTKDEEYVPVGIEE